MLGIGVVLLAVSVLLVVWQGSFNMGSIGPTNPNETLIFWAMSVLILIMITPAVVMAIALERFITRGILVGALKG